MIKRIFTFSDCGNVATRCARDYFYKAMSGRTWLKTMSYDAFHENRKEGQVLRLRLGKSWDEEELVGSPSLRMTEGLLCR